MILRASVMGMVTAVMVAAVVGCQEAEKPAPKKSTPESAPPAEKTQPAVTKEPAPQPSAAPAKSANPATSPDAGKDQASGQSFSHGGLVMAVPAGWTSQAVGDTPMGPVAVYTLPSEPGETEPCSVRITHYPNMKGKDDVNIDRWVGQVTCEGGRPCKKEDAKIEVRELGPVRVTVVDLSGAVSAGMGTTAPPTPNQRLITAIVDHPAGPHFVKALGATEAMKRHEAAIREFLGSAKTAG